MLVTRGLQGFGTLEDEHWRSRMSRTPVASMLNRIRSIVELFRPRAIARMAKSVASLGAAVQELRRGAKESDAALASLANRTEQLERELRSMERSLADVSLRAAQTAVVYRRDREQADALKDLPSILDFAAIEAHASAAIARAPLHLEPFPHLVVEDLWPDAFYNALIEGLPPSPLFGGVPLNKERLTVPFEWAPIYGSQVWSFLVNDVLDRAVAPAVIEKFREPLNE